MHLHSNLASTIPSLSASGDKAEPGASTPEESRAFELWLRQLWTEKEGRMEGFYQEHHFDGPNTVIPVKQQ